MSVNHSDSILSVHRLDGNLLRSECTLLETDREVSSWILVDIPNMVIQDAAWEIYRFPGKHPMSARIPKLNGIEAALNSGGKLAMVLKAEAKEPYPVLILECVRGIIQVGCFFTKEMGFETDYAYIKLFEELYKKSCLVYSNPDKWDWTNRVYPKRECVIFKRVNSVTVKKEPSGECSVVSSFRDSHQQMSALTKTDSNGVVLSIEGNFTLYPDILCRSTMLRINDLVGLRLAGMQKRDLGSIVGGESGCDHLLSMLYKTAQTLDETIKSDSEFHRRSPS
jgi:hypothetical protein